MSARRTRQRTETPFSWRVTCGGSVYGALAGIRADLLYRDPRAIREAYLVGYPLARELLGPDVEYEDPNSVQTGYGHVNGLGSELTYPEDSELGCRPIYESLAEGIRALRRPVDWATAGEMPLYLETWIRLRQAFPDRDIPFDRFRAQGPITTAWLLRGQDFFFDLYDEPALCHEYLRLVTDSVVSFRGFLLKVNGQRVPPAQVLVTDDVAAMLPPRMWADTVVPLLKLIFVRQPSRERAAHIENLVPDHLPFLDELGLDAFDPTVSPRLTPADVRDRCSVPFEWHLNPMQQRDFSEEQVSSYLVKAAQDGASSLMCHLGRDSLAGRNSLRNARLFVSVAKEIARDSRLGQVPGDSLPS